jgi:hypothetical protein
MHPMVLPVIFLSLKIEGRSEVSQQEAQNQIRLIEVRLRNIHPINHASISENEGITPEAVNADLSACHKRVWKRPETYLEVIDEFQRALQMAIVPSVYYNETPQMFSINLNLQSRIELLRQRMRGIQSSAYTTLDMIDMRRSVLHNILLNQQNQIALQIESGSRDKRKKKNLPSLGGIELSSY